MIWIVKTGVWAPIIVLILHEFLSIKGWRAQIDWFNHFSGGLAFTYFAWKCIPFLSAWIGTLTLLGRLACAFLSGCSAALLWDIIEFAFDVFLHTEIQQSIRETMMDLVNGFLGTTTTVIILGVREFVTEKFCHANLSSCAELNSISPELTFLRTAANAQPIPEPNNSNPIIEMF